MNLEKIDQKIFKDIFRQLSKTAWVTLQKSKTKVANYDPFRDTGYIKTNQNQLPVKVISKTLTPGSLIHKDLGLIHTGAIQIILKQADVTLIKNSIKIVIDSKEYYAYDKGLGNRFQEFPSQFSKYSKVIIFRRDV